MAITMTSTALKGPSTATLPLFQDSAGTQYGTLCRAWINLNMATSTILSSFNIASVTKIGTGVFDVTLTNPISNYCAVSGSTDNANNGTDMVVVFSNYSTNTFRLLGFYTVNSGNRDITQACAAIFA